MLKYFNTLHYLSLWKINSILNEERVIYIWNERQTEHTQNLWQTKGSEGEQDEWIEIYIMATAVVCLN